MVGLEEFRRQRTYAPFRWTLICSLALGMLWTNVVGGEVTGIGGKEKKRDCARDIQQSEYIYDTLI